MSTRSALSSPHSHNDLLPPRRLDALKNERLTIPVECLPNLLSYKYVAAPTTKLDQVLSVAWSYMVHYLPLWLAPNVITLLGTICLVSSYTVMAFFTSSFEHVPPQWTNFICGAGILIYQTMDALDGKQARRTKSASPLGQLFDHGCDCISTTFMALCAASGAQLGPGWKTLVLVISLQTAFFLAQWEEFHTRIFRTSAGPFGVTEGQVVQALGLFVTGFLGADIWHVEIQPFSFLPPINPGEMLLVGTCAASIGLAFVCITNTFQQLTPSDRSTAFKQLLPLAVVVGVGLWWCSFSPFKYPQATMLVIGGAFTNLTYRMILCSMTHMPFPALYRLPTVYLLPLTLYAQTLETLSSNGVSEIVLGAYGCFSAGDLLYLVVSSIQEVAAFLEISVFSISPPRND